MAATAPAGNPTRAAGEGATGAPGAEEETSGRRLALDVHAELRRMILSCELPPGSVVPQAKMARLLGVSRTPMREAFRLLQEEGLIESRPDQRARVRSVDPVDLDAVYGSRIALEALAAGISIHTLGEADFQRLQDALDLMHAHSDDARPEEWHAAHRDFHQITTQAAGPDLQRMLTSLREHSERYIRLAQLGVPESRARARTEHEAILDALRRADETAVVHTLARHLTRTALGVLADIAPEHDPVTTRAALSMATGGRAANIGS
jgi:DNA-binding GntR family transcriptional regulator